MSNWHVPMLTKKIIASCCNKEFNLDIEETAKTKINWSQNSKTTLKKSNYFLQLYKWRTFCFYKVGDEMGAFTFEKLLRFCTRVEWVVTCLFWEIRQINCHPNDPDSPSGFWYRIGITRAKRVLGFKAMVPQISVYLNKIWL